MGNFLCRLYINDPLDEINLSADKFNQPIEKPLTSSSLENSNKRGRLEGMPPPLPNNLTGKKNIPLRRSKSISQIESILSRKKPSPVERRNLDPRPYILDSERIIEELFESDPELKKLVAIIKDYTNTGQLIKKITADINDEESGVLNFDMAISFIKKIISENQELAYLSFTDEVWSGKNIEEEFKKDKFGAISYIFSEVLKKIAEKNLMVIGGFIFRVDKDHSSIKEGETIFYSRPLSCSIDKKAVLNYLRRLTNSRENSESITQYLFNTSAVNISGLSEMQYEYEALIGPGAYIKTIFKHWDPIRNGYISIGERVEPVISSQEFCDEKKSDIIDEYRLSGVGFTKSDEFKEE